MCEEPRMQAAFVMYTGDGGARERLFRADLDKWSALSMCDAVAQVAQLQRPGRLQGDATVYRWAMYRCGSGKPQVQRAGVRRRLRQGLHLLELDVRPVQVGRRGVQSLLELQGQHGVHRQQVQEKIYSRPSLRVQHRLPKLDLHTEKNYG